MGGLLEVCSQCNGNMEAATEIGWYVRGGFLEWCLSGLLKEMLELIKGITEQDCSKWRNSMCSGNWSGELWIGGTWGGQGKRLDGGRDRKWEVLSASGGSLNFTLTAVGILQRFKPGSNNGIWGLERRSWMGFFGNHELTSGLLSLIQSNSKLTPKCILTSSWGEAFGCTSPWEGLPSGY